MKIETIAYSSLLNKDLFGSSMKDVCNVLLINDSVQFVSSTNQWTEKLLPIGVREKYTYNLLDKAHRAFENGYETELTFINSTSKPSKIYLRLSYLQKQKLRLMNKRHWIQQGSNLTWAISFVVVTSLTIFGLWLNHKK